LVTTDELKHKELKFLGWKGPKAGERLVDKAAKQLKNTTERTRKHVALSGPKHQRCWGSCRGPVGSVGLASMELIELRAVNSSLRWRTPMARKYSTGASKEVENEMHRYKQGTAKSGKGGKGGSVKSRKQAVAIALSKARKKGKKVPKKKAA
jgi:hypothetical protein